MEVTHMDGEHVYVWCLYCHEMHSCTFTQRGKVFECVTVDKTFTEEQSKQTLKKFAVNS